ncbi:MAG: hypothetical protein NTX21_11380 [Alphaproteobacteria bacterium]|nr:hypothetical protein [Alphaproteobacteria bacterium]
MSSAPWQTSSATPSIWPKPSDIFRTSPAYAARIPWTLPRRNAASCRTEKPAGAIGNHSACDEAATKIEKIRAKPNDDNPFFIGTASALRYLRVLKECNLNNAEIEWAQRKP